MDRDLHGQRHKILTRTDITDDASERNEERETKERKEKRKENALDALEQLLEINEEIEHLGKRIDAWDNLEKNLQRHGKLDVTKPEVYNDLLFLGIIDAGDSLEDAQRKADQIDQDDIERGRQADEDMRNKKIEEYNNKVAEVAGTNEFTEEELIEKIEKQKALNETSADPFSGEYAENLDNQSATLLPPSL